MTKKEERQFIFKKFGGRCAYCGCHLPERGWHVDELEPVRRTYKYKDAYWEHKVTKERVSIDNNKSLDEVNLSQWKYINRKLVQDGCMHPERFHLDNQMPSCASCNINKHSEDLEFFRSLIEGFMKHLNEVSTQYKIAKRYGLVSENTKPVVFYFEKDKSNGFNN